MSRVRRAWRELTRSDEQTPRSLPLDIGGFGYHLREVQKPLERIAAVLDRMERQKKRPRIIECKHPELHPEVELVDGDWVIQ